MPESTQAKIHDAAMIAHEANRAYCLTIGDSSQPDWKSAENWQRDSAIAGAQAIAKDPSTTPEQSHEQWSAHKVADGWVYGPVKDPVAKTHPCLVPYDELPAEQQAKDALFGSVVRAILGLPLGPSLDAVPAIDYQLLADDYARVVEDLQQLRASLPAEPPSHPYPSAEPTTSEGAET